MEARRIVLIEDDPAVNEGLELILRRSGYEVHTFLTVQAFEDVVVPNADAYIIDRQLKGTDGLDLCRSLKSNKATSGIPVIIMSATPNVRQYTQEARGDAFLEKPFSKKQLLALLDDLLKPTTGML